MAPHTPSPDDAEHMFFLMRWWRELTLGLIALLSSAALIKKGRSVDTVPIYVTDKQIDRIMQEHAENLAKDVQIRVLELENRVRDEFYDAMRKNNEDLVTRFKELLDAQSH